MDTVRLLAGEIFLGTLTITHFDQPVTYADFEPSDAFERFRHLFEAYSRTARWGGDHFASARKALDELDLILEFSPRSIDRITAIIIEGTKARWRAGASRRLAGVQEMAFWEILGPEIGPETCRWEGCSNLRISCSVFCRRHHYRNLTGRDYTGPEAV
jgi:hypothetical protein